MPKKVLVSGVFLTTALMLGGCSAEDMKESAINTIASIDIPFDWFKDDSKKVVIKIMKVEGMDLAKEEIPTKQMKATQKNLDAMTEVLKDKDTFAAISSGEHSLYRVLGSDYFSLDYDAEHDALLQTMKEIGEVDHQYFDSFTLRQYGARMVKGKLEPYAMIDVNAVNDTKDFRIQGIQLTFDENGKIKSSIQVDEPANKPHTNTPLTDESLLYEDTHTTFKKQMKDVIQTLSNTSIYEQIQLKEVTENSTEIQSLAKKIGLDSEQTTTVYNLVRDGKGKFVECGITGYLFDDNNVAGKTYYELIVSDEKGYHYYTVEYSRGEQKITNITQDSPFKEEVENE